MATTVAIAVSTASSRTVINAGATLAVTEPNWPFVTTPELLLNNGTTYINGKFDRQVLTADLHIFSEYLALATISHALDGWRFLSKSIYAILNGARKQAIHLAYYAELRAAMSILAESGIGINNYKNFSINNQNQVSWFPGRTHVATWEALATWSTKRDVAEKVLDSINVMDLSGSEWADACGVSAKNKPLIITDWMQNWSIDLKRLKDDSDIRNIASYQVHLNSDTHEPLKQSEFNFIKILVSSWSDGGSGFLDWIDLVLIAHLCQTVSIYLYGDAAPLSINKIYISINDYLLKRGLDQNTACEMIWRIEEVRINDGAEMLSETRITNTSAISVIGRAFLLLRLSGALNRKQWEEIRRLSPGNTDRWQNTLLNMYARNSNLIEIGTHLTDFSVLFADQNDSNEDFDVLIKDVVGFEPKYIWDECSEPLTSLCRFERLGILVVNQ